jgi:hypothetical protein
MTTATATTTTAPAMAAPPAIPPMESADSFNPDFSAAPAPPDDGPLSSPIDSAAPAAPASPEPHAASQDTHTQQRVHDVLHSDVGVSTLLSRLKASIASARVRASPRARAPC